MYKYIYVEAVSQGLIRNANHKELISEYSSKGWRFVAAIPTEFNGYGAVKKFDLVFEKEE